MTNEKQKKTTEKYRSNWDNIFKKKPKDEHDKPKENKTSVLRG